MATFQCWPFGQLRYTFPEIVQCLVITLPAKARSWRPLKGAALITIFLGTSSNIFSESDPSDQFRRRAPPNLRENNNIQCGFSEKKKKKKKKKKIKN
jgi:hypothetical protein